MYAFEVADTMAPVLLSSSPGNGATDVASDTTLELVFNEPVAVLTASTGTLFFTPKDDGTGNAQAATVNVGVGALAVDAGSPGWCAPPWQWSMK
jgi:hypothetical protein